DEAPQGGGLADDARVVGCVRGGGHERGDLVYADTAADGVELAPLLQLVGERDRIDRLALCIEGERRSIDLRVRLAIEVARVEDLADGADRAGREHHRPEDGLLGLEILRRHRTVRGWSVVGDGGE